MIIIKYLTISSEQFEIDAKFQKTKNKYMKNKNFRKLKYVSGNPQNAGFCTIYPTASGGLDNPQTPCLNFFSFASLAVLHLLFQNSLLLLKVYKALYVFFDESLNSTT
jgi:hypothetical protein